MGDDGSAGSASSGDCVRVERIFVRGVGQAKTPVEGPADQIFVRQRVSKARVLTSGLDDSEEWHRRADVVEKNARVINERAVLVQCIEHYTALQDELPAYFPAGGADQVGAKGQRASTRKGKGQSSAESGAGDDDDGYAIPVSTFGENLLVSGCDRDSVAIGDRFELAASGGEDGGAGAGGLVLEVSSPRKPCSRVDRRHGSPYGLRGARRYCLTHALAGFFCTVLREGAVQEGATLTLVRRVQQPPRAPRAPPAPGSAEQQQQQQRRWTLRRLSMALYGKGGPKAQAKFEATWSMAAANGGGVALKELCDMEALGYCEWKEECKRLLVSRRWPDLPRPQQYYQVAYGSGIATPMGLLTWPIACGWLALVICLMHGLVNVEMVVSWCTGVCWQTKLGGFLGIGLLWSVFWSSAKSHSADAAGDALDPTEAALASNLKKDA